MAENYFQCWTRHHLTEFWVDSAEPIEIRRAAGWGAVGVTANPVLYQRAAHSSAARWDVEIAALAKKNPPPGAEDICWALIRGIAQEDAGILAPVYDRTNGQTGRVCVQVNPTKHDDAAAMIAQGLTIHGWTKNLLVKIPVTAAGLVAIEELAAHGVNTVGTTCFSVPQLIGVAEAYRRALAKARKKGLDVSQMHSYAVVMTGRLDDHLRDVAREEQINVPGESINRAGEAVAKKAAHIFQERGYESVILIASLRLYHDPGDFIGGNHVLTIPAEVIEQVLAQGLPLSARFQLPVPTEIIHTLSVKLADFRRAYEEGGMSPEEFAGFGPVVKTQTQFIRGYQQMQVEVAERMAALRYALPE